MYKSSKQDASITNWIIFYVKQNIHEHNIPLLIIYIDLIETFNCKIIKWYEIINHLFFCWTSSNYISNITFFTEYQSTLQLKLFFTSTTSTALRCRLGPTTRHRHPSCADDTDTDTDTVDDHDEDDWNARPVIKRARRAGLQPRRTDATAVCCVAVAGAAALAVDRSMDPVQDRIDLCWNSDSDDDDDNDVDSDDYGSVTDLCRGDRSDDEDVSSVVDRWGAAIVSMTRRNDVCAAGYRFVPPELVPCRRILPDLRAAGLESCHQSPSPSYYQPWKKYAVNNNENSS